VYAAPSNVAGCAAGRNLLVILSAAELSSWAKRRICSCCCAVKCR